MDHICAKYKIAVIKGAFGLKILQHHRRITYLVRQILTPYTFLMRDPSSTEQLYQ